MPRNPNCNCEDYPCCGCGTESSQEEQQEQFEEQAFLSGVNDLDDEDVLGGFNRAEPEECEEPFMSDTPMGDAYGGE